MDRGPIPEAALHIEGGKIARVGSRREILAGAGDAEIVEMGNSVLLPGLVNAHTHLELSDCVCGEPPTGGFAGWLVGMLKRTRISPEEMNSAVTRAIDVGVEQCLKFGVTTVGDISRQVHLTRPLLGGPMRVVSFGEVQAMAMRRGLLDERLAAADESVSSGRLRIGISPHAPYSIEPEGYRRCLEIACAKKMPLCTHLAETRDEAEFLSDHCGPLRELWDAWLTWDDRVPKFEGGPLRYARELGLLDEPTVLAHVNYCDDEELAILAEGRASVVYCPRTHDYFRHPPHRWRNMLERKINVAVGTDSCASSPDLNLVDDLRLIHRESPEVEPGEIWELATIRGARALGLSGVCGLLSPGFDADITAFPVSGNDPLKEILETEVLPLSVWISGEQTFASR